MRRQSAASSNGNADVQPTTLKREKFSVLIQLIARGQDGSIMLLAMKFTLTPSMGCHHFSTMRVAEKVVCAYFQTENYLVIVKTEIPLRKGQGRFKVYLDFTITKRSSQRLKEQEQSRSARLTSCSSTCHRRLGYLNSRAMGKAQRGAGVDFMSSLESSETCLLNKTKQLPYPKKTGPNATQLLELVRNDIIGLIRPKSLGIFLLLCIHSLFPTSTFKASDRLLQRD